MKTLFNLGDRSARTEIILCEWGQKYCCLAGYDQASNNMVWITYNTYERLDNVLVQSLLNEVEGASKIVNAVALPEFVLTPTSYDGRSVLNSLYTNTIATTSLSDTIQEWQLNNHFLVPAVIQSVATEKFSSASFMHFFTTTLKVYNGFVADEQIAMHFSPNQFTVLVKKSNQLQLAQMYTYQTPLDVIYYLLKIVESLNLSIDNVQLVISGLIEEDSDLYKDLYNYISQVHFATPVASGIDNQSYPPHYFTSIYNLAACV